MVDLQFDPAAHAYRLAGRPVPSVTQVLSILQDWGRVDADVLARAAQFGTHVHEAVALHIAGTLDESDLDPALLPYLEDWKAFLRDTGAEVVHSEMRVASARAHYAGTLDIVARINGVLAVVDIKTGAVPRTVGPQLAAYAEAFNEMHGGKPIRQRRSLQLTGSGYHMTRHDDPADLSVFLSALNCWRFRNA